MKTIKFLCVMMFIGLGFLVLLNDKRFVRTAAAFSAGPPPGFTGAPGEQSCVNCHITDSAAGQFTVTPPATYTPGQTYQIVVRHISSDATRQRWGFQLTALAGSATAGTMTGTTGNTQTVDGGNGRFYTQHTTNGTFAGTQGGAVWTFNWTAPATNVGPVTFYAAGNQANNDGNITGDRIFTAVAASQPATATVSRPPIFDFDGDDKTDLSIFRPGPGEWWYLRSSDGGNFAAQFGLGSDRITPADFTGDGKTDIAFFRNSTGEWYVLRSEDSSFYSFPFGASGDVPAPADYDGDNKADAAVFRPSSSTWFISRSSGGTTIQSFGQAGDMPVAADYDGDNKADIAIYRPSVGEWWIQRSTAGLIAFQFGSSTDKTASGDFTGDGKADVAFWRPASGEWFVLRSEDQSFYAFPFGANGDTPVPGDYDGDGKLDAAVFRASSSTWFAQRSTAGTLIQSFGTSGDVPTPNAFVR